MDKLITIIIPIYNVEAYLTKCLDSILIQTYRNLEILLIDDGSTDSCGEICDKYKSIDNRIKVIHKVNGGISDARNCGLSNATGELISFIDSDDWVHKEYIETLYKNLITYKADISSCSYIKVKESSKIIYNSTKKVRTKVYTSEEAIANILYRRYMDNSPWGKLYKKKLFDGLEYQKGIIYEDLDLFYRIYERANLIVHTNKQCYFYLLRKTSLIRTFNDNRLIVLDITDKICLYMKIHHPILLKAAYDRKLSATFNILYLLLKFKSNNDTLIKECWKTIKQLRKNCLIDIHSRRKNKFACMFSFLGFTITKNIFLKI